jgi:hypothetical protein
VSTLPIPQAFIEFSEYLRAYCEERGLSGRLEQRQWDDFVDAMNHKAQELHMTFDPATGCISMRLDA